MAEITAAMVKSLRDATQLPMMECKKALAETNGDVEAAKQMLREQGKKFMGKREGRATEEGIIAVFADVSGKAGAMIELQCESAPVSTNAEFVQLANDLARQLATGPGASNADELWSQPSPSRPEITLTDQKDELQNKIREVFRLARLHRIDHASGGYVHHDGKTAVLLAVEGGDNATAKEISMHVAAMKPKVLSATDLAKEDVEKERATLTEAARAEGKPENIIDKMVDGRMRNYYSECVLMEQPFIKDDKQTVGKLAESKGMKLIKFIRWELGEDSKKAGAGVE